MVPGHENGDRFLDSRCFTSCAGYFSSRTIVAAIMSSTIANESVELSMFRDCGIWSIAPYVDYLSPF